MYMFGCVIGFILFAVVFFFNKKQRIDMIIMGACFGVLAVIIAKFYALSDYWTPDYLFPGILLEDFLYGLFFGGFLSGTANMIHNRLEDRREIKIDRILLVVSLPITILSFYILVEVLGLNSIYAHILPPFIIGSIIVFKYPSLLIPSLLNSLLAVLVTLCAFKFLLAVNPNFFTDFWLLDNISNLSILKIPLEELLFAASLGFGAAFYYPALLYKNSIR